MNAEHERIDGEAKGLHRTPHTKNRRLDPRSLNLQLVIAFIGFTLMTAIAVGLPALLLLGNQLESQAWTQLEQGASASQALYAARENELLNLATLTAQRPTIRSIMTAQNFEDPPRYLQTLQQTAGLDLILLCNASNELIATTGSLNDSEKCSILKTTNFSVDETAGDTSVLMHAMSLIQEEGEDLGGVVVGLFLDHEFASSMKHQTGIEHTFTYRGEPFASSFPSTVTPRALDSRGSSTQSDEGAQRYSFEVADEVYYATRYQLNSTPVEVEVALGVQDIASTKKVLTWGFAGGILIVAIMGSILGVHFARRVSGSLTGLTEAAASFSKGDLESQVTVDDRVREVALVANALEGARIDLQKTLSELRREKAWSDDLLKGIVEGIMTLDEKGRITFFSPGAERITGWRSDMVIQRSCDEVFLPVDTDRKFSEFLPIQRGYQRIAVELRDGQQATLAITEAKLAPSEAIDADVVLVFRDISEQEAMHRLLSNFLANIAHEFRTPLSSLAASIELLVDQVEELSESEIHELLSSLYLGTLSLQTLVDNLLESASIEARHFHVSPRAADLAQIIGEATRVMQPLIEKRKQQLVVELPTSIPAIYVDPRRTIQVMVNLLSNANKYAPDYSMIAINARIKDDWVKVSVADQGPGIDPNQRANVFRRFSRVESGDNEATYGAGLGLSVVKTIIEAYGGEVGVDKEDGGGSIFWFTVPIMK
ncbi:MAG: PAS domain S-box protein [Anaerolineales bacterium]|nr:PAS domain S-box protein [Anaerolineales bacterium]